MGATKKSLPMDPSIYGRSILESKSGLGGAGNVASPYIKTRRYFYMDIFCVTMSRIMFDVISSFVKTIWVNSGISGIT